jgi:NAD(P)-dependent dehydrogenase (short-subunit alcohol dehydrogenase family)
MHYREQLHAAERVLPIDRWVARHDGDSPDTDRTSGMGSLADNTSGGSIAYRSSKAALNMVMRSAAIDLAPRGVSCIVLNPGWVKTDMGGPNATITPQESVGALRRLIAGLGAKDSGKFYHYDGSEYPW